MIRKLSLICAWGAILFLGAPFLYAFCFCFPAGDDFDGATRAMFLFDLPGAIYEVGREWLTWSGRFTYHFLAVFLGKAASIRVAYSLACAGILFLHGAGFFLVCRACGVQPGSASPLAALATLALFAFHHSLPNYYLLTDALTMGLQEALFLFFLAAIINLWLQPSNKSAPRNHAFRKAAFTGVLAIGVYEHAAVAVFWTCSIALALGYAARRKPPPRFLKLYGVIIAALLFSFLAPGNFQRAALRGVDSAARVSQAGQAFPQWLDAMGGIFQNGLVGAGALMGVLAGLIAPVKKISPQRSVACLFGLVFLSLSLVCLQAMGDAPFPSSPKFQGSLNFYAALAAAIGIYNLVSGRAAFRRFAIPGLIAALLSLVAFSANFQETASSAANGKMAYLNEFMERRENYLRELAAQAPHPRAPFGLWGEIREPLARKGAPDPDLPFATVAAFSEKVFPVRMGEPLGIRPEAWPNKWAAWMYGVGGILAVIPDGAEAAALIAAGEGQELEPQANGVDMAWRVHATGPNPTFPTEWLGLRLKDSINGEIGILLPSRPQLHRLAPMPLQKKWLEKLAQTRRLEYGFTCRAAGILLNVSQQDRRNGIYLAPLGFSQTPAFLFIRLDSKYFSRLSPYIN